MMQWNIQYEVTPTKRQWCKERKKENDICIERNTSERCRNL